MAEDEGRILVVEDESAVREALSEYLAIEGFSVSSATCAQEMWEELDKAAPDLVLLDIGLPDSSGFAIAKELAEHPAIAVIIVTGKSDTVDKIVGLEIGADDYITKPFDMREVLARIRSVLRRASHSTNTAPAEINASNLGGHRVALFEGWRLDITSEELFDPAGDLVKLTNYEYRLLVGLVLRPNCALTREELQTSISGRDWEPYERNIDVLVGKLRKKIEANPREPRLIRTIRNTGYKFTGLVSVEQQMPG